MQASKEEPATALNVSASIGFNRDGKDCMVIHPSDMHFIWAQGRLIVIKSIGKEKNTYLKGHEGRVNCIKCSKKGTLLASGEIMGPGAQVAIIVWDFSSHDNKTLCPFRIFRDHVGYCIFNDAQTSIAL